MGFFMTYYSVDPGMLLASTTRRPEAVPVYDLNGGTVVAVAGEDFCLVGSDTRLGTGYSIYTRNQSKLFRLTEKAILGTCGCWCDCLALARLAEARFHIYFQEHNKPMSTQAAAQMMSVLMYNKRFFPYYANNILAGLDEEGRGAVYSYDPVGHYSRSDYRATGNSRNLLQALMDNQLGGANMEGASPVPPPQERATLLVKDAFISAAEREIGTGDAVVIAIISKDGIREETFPLRRD